MLQTQASKSQLRSSLAQARQKLSDQEAKSKSQKVVAHLLDLDQYRNAESILCYVSHQNEVKTHQLIKKLLKTTKKVCVPAIDNQDTIKPALLTNFSQLKPGKYGVLEPIQPNYFQGKIDLNLMPALAVSRQGQRLGRGKGYYDRFLRQNRPQLNLGLVFKFQILDKIPYEDHDQRIDGFVSETDTDLLEGNAT